MPTPALICSRCKAIVLQADGAAVIRIQRVGGNESRRVLCLDCANEVLAAMTVKPELEAAGLGR